ncbi:serine threonine kinase [Fusarium sp. NRRL 25303]|nr:serine threonine kinase [Fusarium sp. NRRL 25303]
MNKIPADIHVVENSFFQRFFPAPSSNHNEQKPWPDTQVIGVEAENFNDYDDSTFRLYEDAEKVFQEQPMRLFLHGFLLCEDQIELWLFSRSGIYRSGLFLNRITNYSGIFARYSKMSEAQRGINPAIHKDEDGSQYIYVKGSANNIEPYESEHPREYKLRLDKRPYWIPPNLSDKFPTSCGATDCYGTRFLVMFLEINLELFGAENLLNPPEHPTLGTRRVIDYQCLDAHPVKLSCVVWP